MSPRKIAPIIALCVLLAGFVAISNSSLACFSWSVTCTDDSHYVDAGDYTLYEIQVQMWPGCRSTYWLDFASEDVPSEWSTAILDESGEVIPYGDEFYLSGSVTYIFTLKVITSSNAVGGESAMITTRIHADDKYNEEETLTVETTTTINSENRAPTPVTLSQTGYTNTSIDLTWTKNTDDDFDRYDLHISTLDSFTPVSGTLIATFANRESLEQNVTNLSSATFYYFVVRVWDNDATNGPFFADSNLLEGHTGGVNFKPTAVVLSDPEDVTNRNASLTWTQNYDDDFDRYEVHVSLNPDFTPDETTKVGDSIVYQNILKQLVEGLEENATIYFKVRVYDTGGMYNDSNEVSCTTPDLDPEASVLEEPSNTTHDHITLNWTQNCDTDFDRYEVYASDAQGFTPGEDTLVTTIDNMTQCGTVVGDLEESTTYYLVVRTVDESGRHSDSNEVSAATPKDPNEAPLVVINSLSGEVVDDSLHIGWTATDPNGDVLKIRLYYDNDQDPSNGLMPIIIGLDNTGMYAWDTAYIPEGDYYIYVLASDGFKESGTYSDLFTLEHADVTPEDGAPGNTDIGMEEGGDSFVSILFWVIFLAILISLAMVVLMFLLSRRDLKVGPRPICRGCGQHYKPFDYSSSEAVCPYCGATNRLS